MISAGPGIAHRLPNRRECTFSASSAAPPPPTADCGGMPVVEESKLGLARPGMCSRGLILEVLATARHAADPGGRAGKRAVRSARESLRWNPQASVAGVHAGCLELGVRGRASSRLSTTGRCCSRIISTGSCLGLQQAPSSAGMTVRNGQPGRSLPKRKPHQPPGRGPAWPGTLTPDARPGRHGFPSYVCGQLSGPGEPCLRLPSG